jgi:crossover junction endodeoxyribonuclease RuvC
MRMLGIDPGLEGAIAWRGDDGDGVFGVSDIPTMGEGTKRRVNGAALADWLRPYAFTGAYFELVGAMPKQGVSSTFRFGEAAGTIAGVLQAMGIPIVRVTPQVWKKHYNLQGQAKEQSRAFAIQLFPECASALARKKDHQRAEALLLAAYGIWHQKKMVGE